MCAFEQGGLDKIDRRYEINLGEKMQQIKDQIQSWMEKTESVIQPPAETLSEGITYKS